MSRVRVPPIEKLGLVNAARSPTSTVNWLQSIAFSQLLGATMFAVFCVNLSVSAVKSMPSGRPFSVKPFTLVVSDE